MTSFDEELTDLENECIRTTTDPNSFKNPPSRSIILACSHMLKLIQIVRKQRDALIKYRDGKCGYPNMGSGGMAYMALKECEEILNGNA